MKKSHLFGAFGFKVKNFKFDSNVHLALAVLAGNARAVLLTTSSPGSSLCLKKVRERKIEDPGNEVVHLTVG